MEKEGKINKHIMIFWEMTMRQIEIENLKSRKNDPMPIMAIYTWGQNPWYKTTSH